MTHICISKLTTIDSDNGLSPERRQAIIWTNVGILLIGPLGTNFREFLIRIHTFSFKEMHLKMSSAKWWPFCLSLNVLKDQLKSLPVYNYVLSACCYDILWHVGRLVCPCHMSQNFADNKTSQSLIHGSNWFDKGGHETLTHWGRDKMAAMCQTTFSDAFSWMKMYGFD